MNFRAAGFQWGKQRLVRKLREEVFSRVAFNHPRKLLWVNEENFSAKRRDVLGL